MLFFIFSTTVVSEQLRRSEELKGRVNAYVSNLEGIYVINLKTEQSVLTDGNGGFDIEDSVGYTLVFSGMQFKLKEIALRVEDFESELLHGHLVVVMNELSKVVFGIIVMSMLLHLG